VSGDVSVASAALTYHPPRVERSPAGWPAGRRCRYDGRRWLAGAAARAASSGAPRRRRHGHVHGAEATRQACARGGYVRCAQVSVASCRRRARAARPAPCRPPRHIGARAQRTRAHERRMPLASCVRNERADPYVRACARARARANRS
jgi:hypothetical protein